MKKRIILLCVLLLFLTSVFPPHGFAAKGMQRKRVILILAAGLALERIDRVCTPHLYAMTEKGSVGMMSTRTADGDSLSGAYLTLGAGNKGMGEKLAGLSLNSLERIHLNGEEEAVSGKELYERHWGIKPQGEIVTPFLIPLTEANRHLPYRIAVGWLGEQVHHAGGQTAVLGNGDWGQQYVRLAPLLTMDGTGQSDWGRVDRDLLCRDAGQPFAQRTDYGKLYREYIRVRDRAMLTVIETGDLLRLYGEREEIRPSVFARLYLEDLQRLDQFVGRLLPEIDEQTLLLLVSPFSFAEVGMGHQGLTPLLIAGGTFPSGGILHSPTTKIPGLVANYDVAPTVAAFLGGFKFSPEVLGQPLIGGVLQGHSLSYLHQAAQEWELPNQWRAGVLHVYVELLLILLLYAAGATLLHRPWPQRVLEAMLWVPLSLLLAPWLRPPTPWQHLLSFFGIFVLLCGGSLLVKQREKRLLLIGGLTLGGLLSALCSGASLLRRSWLGYDVISGARYYGMGNEAMGMLIGASLLFVFAVYAVFPEWKNKGGRWWLPLFFFILYVLASPHFASNAGGAVTAAVGYSYTLRQFSRPWRERNSMALFLAALSAALTLMLFLHLALPPEKQTHIGRAGELLLAGDFQDIAQIIARKAQLNWHLLVVSVWGKLCLFTLMLTCGMLWRTEGCASVWREGLSAALVSAMAAFFFNDSGVIAAGEILIFLVIPALGERALPPSGTWAQGQGEKGERQQVS